MLKLSNSEERKQKLREAGQSEVLDPTGVAAQRNYKFMQEVVADFLYKAIKSEQSAENILLVV